MIGLVDLVDSLGQFRFGHAPAPDFAHARQAPGHQAQPAARAPPGRLPRAPLWHAPRDHVPIDVVGRAVQVDHRPRRVRDKQPGAGLTGQRLGEKIDETILEP